MVNPHLMRDLIQLGLWDEKMKNQLIYENGSVQNISGLSEELKALYKTVWEIPQRELIKMAVDRAPFIDQSQSLNLHVAAPTYSKLTSMHFFAWENGLKTGMYYLRTRPAVNPVQFTVDKLALNESTLLKGKEIRQVFDDKVNKQKQENEEEEQQTECMMCSG